MTQKDYYDVLGLARGASKDDVRKAFHKLAHKYHPDKKGGDEAKFKEINEAYQVLSDDKRRAEYDAYGRTFSSNGGADQGDFANGFDFSGFANGQDFQFDLGDIFNDFFGGAGGKRQRSNRGRDISVDIQISFTESIFGSERKLLISKIGMCDTCSGTGAKTGTTLKTCAHCGGQGQVHETKSSIFGTFSTLRECSHCAGRGKTPDKPCDNCRGLGILKKNEEIGVGVPSGIQNGEMIRLTGKGEAVSRGIPGDLYVKVHVDKNPLWKRVANDLVMDLNIKLTDSILGADYVVPALDGDIKIKIPEGVSQGEFLRVKERGVPVKGAKRGDILVRVVVKTPTKLSKNARKLVEELKEEGV